MLRAESLERHIQGLTIRVPHLEIEPGQVFVLLGPTGAGKSCLLEVLAGFASPLRGRVWLADRDITDLPPESRRMALLFQEPYLFPNLNVAANIRYGAQDPELFDRLVQALSLKAHLEKPVAVLSGGEKQLVALARALMVRPLVLLLDEAFSAVDPEQRRHILQVFQGVQKEFSITTLAVTHNFEEALTLGSRVGIMMDGELIQTGEPEDVFLHPTSANVARFLGAGNLFQGVFEPGESEEDGGVSPVVFSAGPIQIQAVGDHAGPGYVLIHERDITISVEEPHPSSALNQLEGRILEISHLGAVCRLTIEAGLPFRVTITPRSLANLKLSEGSQVHLSFKAAAVRTFLR